MAKRALVLFAERQQNMLLTMSILKLPSDLRIILFLFIRTICLLSASCHVLPFHVENSGLFHTARAKKNSSAAFEPMLSLKEGIVHVIHENRDVDTVVDDVLVLQGSVLWRGMLSLKCRLETEATNEVIRGTRMEAELIV